MQSNARVLQHNPDTIFLLAGGLRPRCARLGLTRRGPGYARLPHKYGELIQRKAPVQTGRELAGGAVLGRLARRP
jgi:hypothetical protein